MSASATNSSSSDETGIEDVAELDASNAINIESVSELVSHGVRVTIPVIVLRQGTFTIYDYGVYSAIRQEYILMDGHGVRINAAMVGTCEAELQGLLKKGASVTVLNAEVKRISGPFEHTHPHFYLQLDSNSRVQEMQNQISFDLIPYQFISVGRILQDPRSFDMVDVIGTIAVVDLSINHVAFSAAEIHMSFTLEDASGSFIIVNLEDDLAGNEGRGIARGELLNQHIAIARIRVEFVNGKTCLRSTRATAVIISPGSSVLSSMVPSDLGKRSKFISDDSYAAGSSSSKRQCLEGT